MFRTLVAVLLGALTIIAIPAPPLQAQPSDNCHDNRAIKAEAIIEACTAKVKSERLSRKDLAGAYNLRGLAYQRQGDYDRAIVDFNLAINTEPKFSTAYSNLANS